MYNELLANGEMLLFLHGNRLLHWVAVPACRHVSFRNWWGAGGHGRPLASLCEPRPIGDDIQVRKRPNAKTCRVERNLLQEFTATGQKTKTKLRHHRTWRNCWFEKLERNACLFRQFVTPFALKNAVESDVTVYFDSQLLSRDDPDELLLNFHPLNAEFSTCLSLVDLVRFLKSFNFTLNYIDLQHSE